MTVRMISQHVFGLSESESQKMICQNVVHTSPGAAPSQSEQMCPEYKKQKSMQRATAPIHTATHEVSFLSKRVSSWRCHCHVFFCFVLLFKQPCRQKIKEKKKLQFRQMQLQFRESGRWPEDFKYATQPERWRLRRCGSICIAELLNVYVCKCELRPWN